MSLEGGSTGAGMLESGQLGAPDAKGLRDDPDEGTGSGEDRRAGQGAAVGGENEVWWSTMQA